MGLRSDGSVAAWGDNTYGQCNVPYPNSGFVAIAAGSQHSLGLKWDGSIAAWGDTAYGQTGVPTSAQGAFAVAAGGHRSLALRPDAAVGPFVRIGTAKCVTEGLPACVAGAPITAAWTDSFYVQADNSSSGIRVQKASHGLSQGQRAYVAGIVKTNADGERYIDASDCWWTATGPAFAVCSAGRSIGGGDYIDPVTRWGQQGVAGGVGLNNIGLLVRVSGAFRYVDAQTFLIDDGSPSAVKCVVPGGVVLDPAWRSVTVTGISSCEKIGATLSRVLRLRSQADIIPHL
jgi:hypothetical protein